jgi:hypothetical protein
MIVMVCIDGRLRVVGRPLKIDGHVYVTFIDESGEASHHAFTSEFWDAWMNGVKGLQWSNANPEHEQVGRLPVEIAVKSYKVLYHSPSPCGLHQPAAADSHDAHCG